MKTLLTIIFTLSQVWGQSVNASLTIYKDGFGLVKQPVSWNVNAGSNTVKYDRIADGMFAETPFLDLQKAEVHTQRLNRNIFSSNNLFQSQLGQKVKVKLAGEKTVSGILIEYNASQVTLQTKTSIQTFFRNSIDYVSVIETELMPQFRPVLSWDIIAKKSGTVKGNLVYMSGGFDWNANYRMILVENSANAVLIPEAFVTNNSILSFSKLSLQLVEGNLNRTRHQYAKSLQRNAAIMEKAQADMSFSGAAPERDNLGDYYIYSVPNKLDIRGKESITVRLYDAREIG